jgi:hypothetical protein
MRYFGSLWSAATVSVAPLRAYSLLSSGFAAHGAYFVKRTASLPTPLGVGSVAFSGLGEQNAFVGNNCGQYNASRSGACYFSRGMLRRAALLLAPSIAASLPPPKPCGFTKQDLMGLMEKVPSKTVVIGASCREGLFHQQKWRLLLELEEREESYAGNVWGGSEPFLFDF